ncbi:hypothetical protein EQG49_02330 [Periweissella cryptocerci]|uniref:Uncharacterized protein n=1 Tax=Periweissella cryptocerci TaxID=2506420 RepID=A0A4P6YRU2_9LACO|nr:hypothetical protein [Periweissella cryptocerci]QBO35384.1 hypothetical protein EQG49_02330 [Periweissella cryptocerci]
MAEKQKYTVLRVFEDIHLGVIYNIGDVVPFGVKRAEEIIANLDDTFIEKYETPEDDAQVEDTEGENADV